MAVPVLLFVFVFLLLSLALLWRPGRLPLQTSSSRGGAIHSFVHRLLKPRTPDDCPACRLASPDQSLQVTLVQPRERGGKLVAQRYRQRTPAMAAGRTTRRWTAREVLAYPLPKVSA